MPVWSASDYYDRNSPPSEAWLDIGLVNNMPDAALEATERQFRALLNSAANGVQVRLWLYALPEISRSEAARRHIAARYSELDSLWGRRLDGLIVTGAEPRASHLLAEAYWDSLTKVMDWAEENTHSSVWSCLAAHAAVLHLDGVSRRPLKDKRFGLFPCARASAHRLTARTPSDLRMPHSRWNEVTKRELEDCGYQILTETRDAGVDAFVKQRKSLLVFFQGHPEYEVNTLLLEYRRDIGRYLRGVRDTYPLMPLGYFDPQTAADLTALQERAMRRPSPELLAEFPQALPESRLMNSWNAAAARIYGNWLTYLSAGRKRRLPAFRAGRALVANAGAFQQRPVGRQR